MELIINIIYCYFLISAVIFIDIFITNYEFSELPLYKFVRIIQFLLLI